MRIGVFVYDFPHKKCEDFLLRLWLRGPVACVVGAPRVALPADAAMVRAKARHVGSVSARVICERLEVPYAVQDHASAATAEFLRAHRVDIVVIAGARIVPASVIASVPRGVVNVHPGLLPEARGLDALKWSVFYGVRPGATAHLIDERIDAGRLVLRRTVAVYYDDTLVDISLRVEETQVAMLDDVLSQIENAPGKESFQALGAGRLNRRMTAEQDKEVLRLFEGWKVNCARMGAP